MTIDEKLGQMVQAERKTVDKGDIAKYFLGSVLSGGGSAPGDGSPSAWADMTDAMHAEAKTTRLGIPLLYGSDAVHGHNNVAGATIFPHQIGLGCANDPALVTEIARAVAEEVAATGVDWTFAPLVGPARDPRWGRTYETFGEDPVLTSRLGAAAIKGFQSKVMACAKHFAGDGLTSMSTSSVDAGLLDRGDVKLDDALFRKLAIEPYKEAIAANVASIMVSFNSVRGEKMHASKRFVTDVLKRELGFQGIVISDWSGLRELPGTYYEQVVASVNAGIDVTMDAENHQWREFLSTAKTAVEKGAISQARVDDAVRRVLTVKCERGAFEKGPVNRKELARIGSQEHRDLARRAARASFVLLTNDGNTLPLASTQRVHVSGSGANSLARQMGGWTIDWQGGEGKKLTGTTITAGLGEHLAKDPASADVELVVISEAPYAEWFGDRQTLDIAPDDVKALDAASATKRPVIAVILSGRPLAFRPHVQKAKVWIAAWLFGSEGGAIADVLYGVAPINGRLAHAWPKDGDLLDRRKSVAEPWNAEALLFPVGFGVPLAARAK